MSSPLQTKLITAATPGPRGFVDGWPARVASGAKGVSLAFVLVGGGCAAPVDTQTAPATHTGAAAPSQRCRAAQLQQLEGRMLDDALRAELQRSGDVVRILRYGEQATLEYSESRLTVHVDALGRITSIECG
jgi:hypothetical protein